MPIVRVPVVALGLAALAPARAAPQRPASRADVVAAALAAGPALARARLDSSLVRADETTARAFPNPTFAAGYTKDAPRYHGSAELAVDWPWLRVPRVGAAAAATAAAGYRIAFARAAVRFAAETTYTRALAAAAHARLS